jgi:glycosyltransferase involved in cell wall biosynthesis
MLKRNKKNSYPKISVVVPSYNAETFIEETFVSILSQNYPKLEIFVQDGRSTDGTVAIIEKYAEKYPKIMRFVSEKDSGQADAINKGFKKCSGDILTYINADDVYELGAFWAVANSYTKNPGAYWFAGKGKVIDANGKETAKLITFYKSIFLKFNSYQLLLAVNYLMQPSVFLTKRGYEQIEEFSLLGRIVMEYEAWLKLGEKCMPVIINKHLSSFRMSGTNISATLYRQTLRRDQEIVEKYTDNKFLLLIHKINNLGRLGVVQLLH